MKSMHESLEFLKKVIRVNERTGQNVNATTTDLKIKVKESWSSHWNKTCGFYGRSALFTGKHQSNGE